jgi:sec-independent protein translocase protein TatA
MFGVGIPVLLLIGLGMPELLVILVILILIFGTSRIAGLGKGLGEGIRNFKKGVKDEDEPGDQPKAS